jgi:hypothetical protein
MLFSCVSIVAGVLVRIPGPDPTRLFPFSIMSETPPTLPAEACRFSIQASPDQLSRLADLWKQLTPLEFGSHRIQTKLSRACHALVHPAARVRARRSVHKRVLFIAVGHLSFLPFLPFLSACSWLLVTKRLHRLLTNILSDILLPIRISCILSLPTCCLATSTLSFNLSGWTPSYSR